MALPIPQAADSERDLLGSCLLSSGAIRAAEAVEPADFYNPAYGAIFVAVRALYHRGAGVDPTTVADELARDGSLERVGGRARLMEIQAATPASANAVYYAESVARAGALRRAVGVAEEVRAAALALDLDAVEMLLQGAHDRVASPLGIVEPGADFADVLTVEVPEPRWVIPDCLARRDRLMVTGEEGRGKVLCSGNWAFN
jgi:replicative DNA helicase